MDDIIKCNHKIGSNPEDIKNIYIHVNDTNEFDTVYIIYNNEKIEKFNKPDNMKQEEFLPEFKTFLLSVGANNSNRNSIWFLVKDDNQNININDIEEKYKKQKEFNDINNIEYRKFKARVVKRVLTSKDIEIKPIILNAFSTGVFTLTSIVSSNQHNDLMHKITTLAAIIGLILTSISMDKFRRKLFDIMIDERKININNNESQTIELLEDNVVKK